MLEDEEFDEDEVMSPVLTPSPLRTVVIGGAFQTVAAMLTHLGEYVWAIGAAYAGHVEAKEERRAFQAAVVTEIETLTGE